MSTILVLGAGGFIGKQMCLMLSKNHNVKAYDIITVDEFKNTKNIEMITGDFCHTDDFCSIIDKVDVIYHFISTTLPNDKTDEIPDEIEQNIIPTVRLLECMVKSKVREIIFASSAGTIYGETGNRKNCVTDPLNPICSYGIQKKVIEAYLQFYGVRYGINYKIARLANPYGIGQNVNKPQGVIPIYINHLLSDRDIKIYGDGTNERDYIYMDDMLEALIKVHEYKGDEHIFNIGTGQVYSLRDIINIIENTANKKFTKIHYEAKRYHDVTKTLLDVRSTQEILNWTPNIDIDLGIKKVLSWLQGERHLL